MNYIISQAKDNKNKRVKKYLIHKNRMKKYFGHFVEDIAADFNLTRNDLLSQNEKSSLDIMSSPMGQDGSVANHTHWPSLENVAAESYTCRNEPVMSGSNNTGNLELANDTNGNLDKSITNVNNADFSFRPYYVKKTNRKQSKQQVSDDKQLRKGSRVRKQPERFQAI